MSNRNRLSDIINGGADRLRAAWQTTEAADDFQPLPPGEYEAHVLSGELFTANTGTPGYKIAFGVCEGEHSGRRLWLDMWLTEAALSMAKRDLLKLGIVELEQLEQPLPPGIRCKLKVVHRRDDDGNTFNRIRAFEVIGIDKPEQDAFAPAADADNGDDTSFNVDQLEANGGAG